MFCSVQNCNDSKYQLPVDLFTVHYGITVYYKEKKLL